MRPSPHMGSLPRIGLEIEISRWEEQTNTMFAEDWHYVRNKKVKALTESGLCIKPEEVEKGTVHYSKKYHTYNCKCNACMEWVNQAVDPYPVQFALKYDGTLPLSGGEFISTPFSIDSYHWQSFLQGFLILTDTAVPDFQVVNKQGNPSSPSIHIHASCANDAFANVTYHDPFWQFIRAYAPEIMSLAGACDVPMRPLKYTKPYATPDHHHSYMNFWMMRKTDEDGKPLTSNGKYVNAGPHIELRTWQPAYDDLLYVEGAAHVTAALAQVMSNPRIVKKLLDIANSEGLLARAEETSQVHQFQKLVKYVDMSVFNMLEHVLTSVTYASVDSIAEEAIHYMFTTTKDNWL